MDVSVIIPAYNAAKVLPHQLRALAQQKTSITYEVIVADNGSTDSTAQLLADMATTYPVPLRRADASARRGASHARNHAVRTATGQVLAFCDSDDYVSETWVQAAWEGIQAGADVLGGEIRNSQYTHLNPAEHPWEPASTSGVRHAVYGQSVLSSNMVYRAESYRSVGGMDESLSAYGGEDSELSIRASFAGLIFAEQPGLIIYFKPTLAPSVLASKVFQSGINQSLIWYRHRDFYGDHWKPGSTVKELYSWIIKTPSFLKRKAFKQLAHGYILRAGAFSGSIRHTVTGWPEPIYGDFFRD